MKQEIPAEFDTGSDDRKAKLTKLQAHWQTRVGVPGDHRASDSKSSELSFTTRVAKASKEECEDEEKVSQHLDNLVRLVTVARRKEVGDIVWFCYNEQDEPKKKEPIAPFWLDRLGCHDPRCQMDQAGDAKDDGVALRC